MHSCAGFLESVTLKSTSSRRRDRIRRTHARKVQQAKLDIMKYLQAELPHEDAPPGYEKYGNVETAAERDSSESYSTVDSEDFQYARKSSAALDTYPDGPLPCGAPPQTNAYNTDQFLEGVDSHLEGLDGTMFANRHRFCNKFKSRFFSRHA